MKFPLALLLSAMTCCGLTILPLTAQTIPEERRVDWTVAGVSDTSTAGFHVIDLAAAGFVGDGTTANDTVIDSILQVDFHPGAILRFPAGNFLFRNTIRLPSKRVLRGAGPDATRLLFDLGGRGHAITVTGGSMSRDTTFLIRDAFKGSRTLTTHDASLFNPGDWLLLSQEDGDLITSDWALGSTGQIVRIERATQQQIDLSSELRQHYVLQRSPTVRKLAMTQNTGIECLTIERLDDTAPQQSSSIFFSRAHDCWVYGVESVRCTFAHITAEYSSNITVAGSYLHHAFDYGGGGRAYGVVLQFATGECRIENTIFERLRHAMLLQAGANGNVFAWNYSTTPYWTGVNPLIPSDAAGDIVLHGNWPYANLFEHNICQNIVIDNSHGPNGPHNTFFRNRAEAYGIFFSADNSPACNIVGNEITNTSLPYSLVNYSIRGEAHFLYGNNDKGRIKPDSNVALADTSYAYRQRPAFLHSSTGAGIGIPNDIGTGSVPARDRYENDEIFASICLDGNIATVHEEPAQAPVSIYPNPARSHIYVRTDGNNSCDLYVIVDLNGRRVAGGSIGGSGSFIDTAALSPGRYFLLLPELGMHRFVIE